eukprot:6212088-Pleurochrysis_carterae.AAC.1
MVRVSQRRLPVRAGTALVRAGVVAASGHRARSQDEGEWCPALSLSLAFSLTHSLALSHPHSLSLLPLRAQKSVPGRRRACLGAEERAWAQKSVHGRRRAWPRTLRRLPGPSRSAKYITLVQRKVRYTCWSAVRCYRQCAA